jgi:selenocysteine lyase/cysteine desulfurase
VDPNQSRDRKGAFAALRITPNIYSTIRDIDYFSDVMEKELV